ncbi:proline and serine-rich protein 3 [Carettochelys insculpta]|uniref:proline and serine-rich protein 3 n=1 Tax=Carettochelys insculpta TaxID=44489 RepID=UPI003EB70CC3
MESSAALFSAQGSPFATQSPARSHYHPSPARLPGPQHQRTALSPTRLVPGVPNPQRSLEPAASSPPDLSFLQGPSCWQTALDSDSTDPFPELWPSTERSSSGSPQEIPASGQPLGPPASSQDGESVIAKYIERFRHGQPSSRSQRQAPTVPPAREFWWLESAPPSDSSTLKAGPKPDCAEVEEAKPGWALPSPPLRPMGSPSDTSLLESPDPETHSLQERATRLLLRSQSSLSNTVPVSAEGLGSTPTSSSPDLDQALPSPPHLSLPEPPRGRLHPACWPPACIPQCSSSTRPEDDILFQWRLRRKMEQASQAGTWLPLLGWRTPLGGDPNLSEGVRSVRPGLGQLPGTAAWRSGDGKVQPEVRSGPAWASGPPALRQGLGHPTEVPFLTTELAGGQSPRAVPVLGQLAPAATPSSPPQPAGEGGDAGERRGSRHRRGGAGPAEGPGSQGRWGGAGPAEGPGFQDRCGGQGAGRGAGPAEGPGSQGAGRGAEWADGVAQHLPKKIQEPSKPELSQGRAALEPEATSRRRRKNRKEESPIHRALGQVISERLLSPPAISRGRQAGQGAAAETPAPGSQHPQLLRLAAQLLEEAEESDGTEFEEDPMLQVLRSQREDLRSQLRAVDVAMSQLVSQGVTEPPGPPC